MQRMAHKLRRNGTVNYSEIPWQKYNTHCTLSVCVCGKRTDIITCIQWTGSSSSSSIFDRCTEIENSSNANRTRIIIGAWLKPFEKYTAFVNRYAWRGKRMIFHHTPAEIVVALFVFLRIRHIRSRIDRNRKNRKKKKNVSRFSCRFITQQDTAAEKLFSWKRFIVAVFCVVRYTPAYN